MDSNKSETLQTDWFDRWLTSELKQWTHFHSPARHLRSKLLQRAAKLGSDDRDRSFSLTLGGLAFQSDRSESGKVSLFARLMQRTLEFNLLSLRWVS